MPSNLPSELFTMAPSIDAICYGEGEKPLVDLVQAQDKLVHLKEAKSWITREDLKEKKRPVMNFVQELDDIPFMKYDLINFNKYKNLTRYHGEKSANTVTTSLMTSRGCPYMCNFCAQHTVHSRKMRFHSPERVIEEVRFLKETYGVNVFCIEDDLFLVHRKRALEILEKMAKENITLEFPNGMSVFHMNDDLMVDTLKAAGLKIATLAVESGVERVLRDVMHKPYTDTNIVVELVDRLRKKNLYSKAFFVIGLPGETLEEVQQTIAFIKNTGFNWVSVQFASPIAGSELYDECKKKGILMSNSLADYKNFEKCNIKLTHSTPEQMEQLRYEAILHVNFVENYDLKHGDAKQALKVFKDVTGRVPDQAFAHYFSAKAYEQLNNHEEKAKSLAKYFSIINNNQFWFFYSNKFGLPLTNTNNSIKNSTAKFIPSSNKSKLNINL